MIRTVSTRRRKSGLGAEETVVPPKKRHQSHNASSKHTAKPKSLEASILSASSRENCDPCDQNYALVAFGKKMKDGSFKVSKSSVVHAMCVVGTLREQEFVEVLYNRTPYPAKVLRVAGDRKFLEKLRMDTLENVGLSFRSVDKQKRKSKSKAKSGVGKSLQDEEKHNSKLNVSVMSKWNDLISNTSPIFAKKIDSLREAALPASCASSGPSSRSTATQHVNLSALGMPIFQAPHTSPSTVQYSKSMLVSDEEEALILALRNPEVPQVSADAVASLQGLLFVSKLVSAIQCKSKHQESATEKVLTPLERQLRKITSLKKVDGVVADNRVHLYLNSNVYINAGDKDMLTTNFKNDPIELGRRLLKNLLTPDILATLSYKGSKGYPAIPPIVLNAVESYITSLISDEKKSTFCRNFHSKVNLMCGFLRYERKLSKTVSPTTKTGQPRKKAGRKKKLGESSKGLGDSAIEVGTDGQSSSSWLQRTGDLDTELVEQNKHLDGGYNVHNVNQNEEGHPGEVVCADESIVTQINVEEEEEEEDTAVAEGGLAEEGLEVEEQDDDEISIPSHLNTPTDACRQFNFDESSLRTFGDLLVSSTAVLNA